MSWVQFTATRHSEDVFDEDADEIDIAQKEWKNTMEKRVKEGYTEGVEAGKLQTLQQGFNQGYKESVKMMMFCGQLKGTVRALMFWGHQNGSRAAVLDEMSNLLNELQKYEKDMIQNLNCAHIQPHIEDLLDPIEDMDLDHTISHDEQSNQSGSLCENSKCCRNDSQKNSFQDEHPMRPHFSLDSKKPTLALLKEKIVNLVEPLGLSPDTVEHIQLL